MKQIMDLYHRYEEIINYLVVGVLTTVVSLAVYYGLVLTVLDPEDAFQLQAANVISWIAAVAFAYVTNRRYVFKSKSQDRLKEASAFVSSRVVTLLMDMAVMFVLVTVLKGSDKLAKLVSQVVVTVANYVFSKLFVFKKQV